MRTFLTVREAAFLLTLPISWQTIFRWKFFESTLLASWAFLFLIAPLVAAFGVYRDRRGPGWVLGLLVAGGALLAYVASRTVGLPGLPAEPDAWLEPMGVASLVCEGLFVVLFVLAQRARTGASQ